jgi:hypothetical protein
MKDKSSGAGDVVMMISPESKLLMAACASIKHAIDVATASDDDMAAEVLLEPLNAALAKLANPIALTMDDLDDVYGQVTCAMEDEAADLGQDIAIDDERLKQAFERACDALSALHHAFDLHAGGRIRVLCAPKNDD